MFTFESRAVSAPDLSASGIQSLPHFYQTNFPIQKMLGFFQFFPDGKNEEYSSKSFPNY
jgi:hypothetical protein